MKQKTEQIILLTIVFLLAFAFAIKFGGPATLRLYVETGMGNCEKLPVLCLAPEIEIVNPKINQDYLAELREYKLPGIALRLPKEFKAIKGSAIKSYAKKRLHSKVVEATAYLLYEEPDFFVNLFPQLKKQGVKDDYEFIRRTMYARTKKVNNFTDTFFTIMKAIFIPYLGEGNVIMAEFTLSDKRGFINYNFTASGNYFDCNIMDAQSGFFKVYIKDKDATLDLGKVLAIISTVKKTPSDAGQ